MNVQDIQSYLKSLYEVDFPEDVIRYGDPGQEVRGIVTCWMLNLRAVDFAVSHGSNLIVTHETPFFTTPRQHAPAEFDRDYRADRLRREALDASRMAVIQCHRTLDAVCIPHAFEAVLGLGTPTYTEKRAGGYESVRLFEIEPTPLPELIAGWKQAMGLPCVRVAGPEPAGPVRKIGMVWGGIGLKSNLPIPDQLVELGADVLVGGETEEYTFHYCADVGIPLVELGHEASETLGMKVAADRLAQQFPGLPVHYFTEPPLHRFA